MLMRVQYKADWNEFRGILKLLLFVMWGHECLHQILYKSIQQVLRQFIQNPKPDSNRYYWWKVRGSSNLGESIFWGSSPVITIMTGESTVRQKWFGPPSNWSISLVSNVDLGLGSSWNSVWQWNLDSDHVLMSSDWVQCTTYATCHPIHSHVSLSGAQLAFTNPRHNWLTADHLLSQPPCLSKPLSFLGFVNPSVTHSHVHAHTHSNTDVDQVTQCLTLHSFKLMQEMQGALGHSCSTSSRIWDYSKKFRSTIYCVQEEQFSHVACSWCSREFPVAADMKN